jgi:hypothetical protein
VILALLIKLEAHVMGTSQSESEPERAIGAAGGQ